MTPAYRQEAMSPAFTKFHLDGPWPVVPVIHRFTAPDTGDPHDHPWGFQSTILAGGYVEDVYAVERDGWSRRRFTRWPGATHRVEATTIHRIVELLDDVCWTLVVPGPLERVSRFWAFGSDGEVESRAWDEARFRPELLR